MPQAGHTGGEIAAVNASVRTGCFCNPGDSELALDISPDELTSCFVRRTDRLTMEEFRRCMDTKSTFDHFLRRKCLTSSQTTDTRGERTNFGTEDQHSTREQYSCRHASVLSITPCPYR